MLFLENKKKVLAQAVDLLQIGDFGGFRALVTNVQQSPPENGARDYVLMGDLQTIADMLPSVGSLREMRFWKRSDVGQAYGTFAVKLSETRSIKIECLAQAVCALANKIFKLAGSSGPAQA